MKKYEETTALVRGGFTVRIQFRVAPAEPDVGFPQPYADDVQILTERGRPADWLKLDDNDWDAIDTAIADQMSQGVYDGF